MLSFKKGGEARDGSYGFCFITRSIHSLGFLGHPVFIE